MTNQKNSENNPQTEFEKPKSGDALLRIWQIIGCKKRGIDPLVAVSRSTWWRWISENRAPKPLRIGSRTTVWKKSDIDAFIALSGSEEVK